MLRVPCARSACAETGAVSEVIKYLVILRQGVRILPHLLLLILLHQLVVFLHPVLLLMLIDAGKQLLTRVQYS